MIFREMWERPVWGVKSECPRCGGEAWWLGTNSASTHFENPLYSHHSSQHWMRDLAGTNIRQTTSGLRGRTEFSGRSIANSKRLGAALQRVRLHPSDETAAISPLASSGPSSLLLPPLPTVLPPFFALPRPSSSAPFPAASPHFRFEIFLN